MDAKSKKEIIKLCNDWGYEYEFMEGENKFIVYGKLNEDTFEQYISDLLIDDLLALNYHVLYVFYTNNKLEMTFNKD